MSKFKKWQKALWNFQTSFASSKLVLDCLAFFSVQMAASVYGCGVCVCLCVYFEIGSHIAQDSLKLQVIAQPEVWDPPGSASCGLKLQAGDITPNYDNRQVTPHPTGIVGR